MNDDMTLVRAYADRRSEDAFTTLVERHVNLVYSAALRQTRDPHQAKEITQAVFIILASKAGGLKAGTVLPGWLYRTACYVAANLRKTDSHRRSREQEAQMQILTHSEQPDPTWEQLSPVLDEAMAHLQGKDRDAIVLRFFENKSLREVGASLGIADRAAQKRIARGLEKLRAFFTRRGILTTTAIIGPALAANSVHAAPAGLAQTISAAALVKGAAASTSTLTLVKGALKFMAWTKAKTAIVVGIGVLLAAGATTVTIDKINEHKADDSWRVPGFNSRVLDRISPQVRILPSKIRSGSWGSWGSEQHGKLMGTGVSVKGIVLSAYDWWYPARTISSSPEPPGIYDFVASLPSGNAEALQEELKRKFGIVARRELVETNAFLLTVKYPNAPDLKHSSDQSGNGESIRSRMGRLSCQDVTSSDLAANLEEYVKMPIIDQTGLSQRFDVNITWPQRSWKDIRLDALKQALVDQLGLELVPTNMPIEMLVIEKAN